MQKDENKSFFQEYVHFLPKIFIIIWGASFLFLFILTKKLLPSVFVGLILSTFFSLCLSFLLKRNLATEEFEVTVQNKDPQKGLVWYQQEIFQHLQQLRYNCIKKEDNFYIFEPPTINQYMGGNIEMRSDPYSIRIKGPRGFIRIIKRILFQPKLLS